MKLSSAITFVASFAFLLGSGCAKPPPPSAKTGAIGPHRGVMLQLPEALGVAEVAVEFSGNTGRSLNSEVVAYFYGPDASSALQPAPTDVTLLLYLAESKTREKLALKPAARPGDPASAARFAAVPPPGFDGTIPSGTLEARVNGRAISVRF
jgi:hypothetical protein